MALNAVKQFFGLDGTAEPQIDERYYGGTTTPAEEAPKAGYMDHEPVAPTRPRYASFAHTPKVQQVSVASYMQAATIGQPFRDGDVVVFSIAGIDKAEARRVVDFAAGLCFALRGSMQKLEKRRFALVPENVDMTVSEIRRSVDIPGRNF